MENKCTFIKRKTQITSTNNSLKNIAVTKEIHEKIKELSTETRIPMREITEKLILFAMDNIKIEEEK